MIAQAAGFPGAEYFDYYDYFDDIEEAVYACCRFPNCGWEQQSGWDYLEQDFQEHWVAVHTDTAGPS